MLYPAELRGHIDLKQQQIAKAALTAVLTDKVYALSEKMLQEALFAFETLCETQAHY